MKVFRRRFAFRVSITLTDSDEGELKVVDVGTGAMV